MRRILPALLLAASCSLYRPDAGPAGQMPDPSGAESRSFRSLAEACIAWHYSVHPSRATSAGVHDHDGLLERCARSDLDGQAASLRAYLRRLSRIDRALLPDGDFFDSLVMEGHLRARLLDLERIRTWERDPGWYRRIVSDGLHSLAARSFDTPERRMALAAERLGEVPRVLDSAVENLSHTPRILAEIALEDFAGTRAFLKTGLPAAFAAVKDGAIRARFDGTHQPAVEAVERFIDWMRRDLLPKSTGEFAIGAENLRSRLFFQEGIDAPLEEILKRGYEYLRSTQEEMKSLAGDRPVKALLRETSRPHVPAERLLDETRSLLADLRKWAGTLVTVPDAGVCTVRETPEFRRSGSFASMESPGPFEKAAREAYYSITLPDPSWPPERREQHLSFFNRHSLPLVSVHEAYPGHYTQALRARDCPSKVRRAFRSGAFSEGWALYCERLYAERPEASLEVKFHQAHLALLRICRYVTAIEMHSRGMTVDQAVEFFAGEGYMERANAEREARRAAADPMVLVYTLGKVEILQLREEYLRRTRRSLRDFHDDLLRHGAPPLPVMRKILLEKR